MPQYPHFVEKPFFGAIVFCFIQTSVYRTTLLCQLSLHFDVKSGTRHYFCHKQVLRLVDGSLLCNTL